MRGLILAAGRGSRLGNIEGGTPKCLLEVGRKPLIEHQLEALAEAGVAPVALVVGYGADEIREVVGIRAEYILNRRWQTTNSMYSYWIAEKWLQEPVVVLNCDVLFHPKILARLLAEKGDALAYDSRSGTAPEHMKVKVRNKHLADMSKELPAKEASGENLGILCFTAETAQAVAERSRKLIIEGGENGEGAWLGAAVREVAHERPIRTVDMAGLPWGEIDSAYDLEHVRKKVWPAIVRNRSSRWRLVRWATVPVLVIGLALGLFGYLRSQAQEEALSWDLTELVGGQPIQVSVKGRPQRWWTVRNGEKLEAHLKGPAKVRLESRLILDSGARTSHPYVLRVDMDDHPLDLVKSSGKLDSNAKFSQGALGKRRRFELDLPGGNHVLGISLIAARSEARCLVRVRQLEEEDSEPETEEESQSLRAMETQ